MRTRILLATGVVLVSGLAFVQSAANDLAGSRPDPPIVPAVTTPPPAERPEPGSGDVELRLVAVAAGLESPTFVTAPPGDPRLFVTQKAGVVSIVVDGRLRPDPFLDLTEAVTSDGIERGLLGLAFHPEYADNGRFFVDFTGRNGDTKIVEYRADAEDPDRADPHSARIILTVDQPQQYHNGGMLQFGPDGYLYVGLGDGGGIGDEFGNGQDPGTVLGAILRLDVDSADPYGIPSDNPFADGEAGAPEVWLYGLRNPWRFWIDPPERLVYIGDVGQFSWEEIDVVALGAAGANFGWPVMEGDTCFHEEGADVQCAGDGFEMPVAVYGRNPGCAVVGGVVYRGQAIPELTGHYFYGDFCDGFVRSFLYANGRAVAEQDWSESFAELDEVLSFGTDARGEIYVATPRMVYRIEAVR